jgi:hypothetical protein
MTYEEAKPFLKEGMTVRLWFYDGESYVKAISKIENDKLWGFSDKWLNENGYFHAKPDAKIEILTNPDGTPWVHPDKQKFKVGDRVRIVRDNPSENYSGKDVGYTFTIAELSERAGGGHWCREERGVAGGVWDGLLEKISDAYEEPKPLLNSINTGSPIHAMTTFGDSLYVANGSEIIKFNIADFQSGTKSINQSKSIMSNAINFIKNKALKATNPDEYELREAGLHSDCGELTSEGEALHQEFLRELTREKLVATAKELNEEKKSKK